MSATSDAARAVETRENRLEHFPIAFFAIVMGLSGLTLTLRASAHALDLSMAPSLVVLFLTLAVFAAIAVLYALKSIRHPDFVKAEWSHPVRIAFFPAISISILLIATASAPLWPGPARVAWIVGVIAQGILTLAVVSHWIGHRPFQPGHLTPAWFIPAVGNVVVPIAGAGFGYIEVSWLFFSAGIVFWIVLLTLVFNRLVFHDPLPGRLVPTLVILIAPPAIAFVAYLRLGGDIDPFARILLNVAYVFAALVLTQTPKFLRLPFALSWWALSFPVAALAIASLLYAERTGSGWHLAIGLVLTGAIIVIVIGLALRTLLAIRSKQVCLPE